MIRAGLLALVLAGPAGAEGLAGQPLCAAVWVKVAGLAAFGEVTTQGLGQESDWCVAESPVLDVAGQFSPDWHMDRLKFRGSALGWIADGSSLPEGLEITVEGLRPVARTGGDRMDWLFAAQARANAIDAEMSMAWDPAAKALRLEGLSIDFPGENLLDASATLTGIDLSSTGAMQMSATSFALTDLEAEVTTHGLFEVYVLMVLGPLMLPPVGDMDAAVDDIRATMLAGVAALPGTSFSDASKAALVALIGDLPNPAGDLTVAVQAEPGIGPVRFGGYAITGVPQTLAEAAPLFQGVTVDVGWTHAEAP